MVGLTKRQRDACELVANGLSNKQIARQLGIGWRTVQAHRLEAYCRLDVHNGVQLVKRISEHRA